MLKFVSGHFAVQNAQVWMELEVIYIYILFCKPFSFFKLLV